MASTVEKISSNQVKITFDVPAAEFDAAVQKAYLKMRGRVQVPGFRKSHAPRKVIEKMYGDSVFYEDALDIIFPDVYQQAVEENDLSVVDRPEIDKMDQMGVGQDLKFSVLVYVKPDVELGEYKGLKAVKYLHQVTAEDIDQRIERDVDKATTMQDVTDRPVQDGDTVNLNYAGTVDGVAFEGGTAENQTLVIGSGTFIPGFEEQMVGMAIGEEKDLNVTFPDPYQSKELAGKAAVFHVKVNGIQAKLKPELDDDFAADVSDYSTFAEYKEAIEKELKENAEKNADVELENDLIQQVVDASDCDIPQAMIDDEIEQMKRQLKMNMLYQGLKYEDYLKYTGQTEEQVNDMYRPQASNRVKMQLVLEAIIKKENPDLTDEEFEKELEEEAKRRGTELEAFKSSLNDRMTQALRENAKLRKVVDEIKAAAKVEVKDASERVDASKVASDIMEAIDDAEPEEEEKPEEK